MLFLVPFLCRVHFAFLEWWRHLLATSSRSFFVTQTQISNVFRTKVGVWCLKCSTASVKDSKCAMMSGFPPSCSRGQKFIPVISTQHQRPSFAFTNRGIKRDRSQTIKAAFHCSWTLSWQRWLLPWQLYVTVSDSTILRVICVALLTVKVSCSLKVSWGFNQKYLNK